MGSKKLSRKLVFVFVFFFCFKKEKDYLTKDCTLHKPERVPIPITRVPTSVLRVTVGPR